MIMMGSAGWPLVNLQFTISPLKHPVVLSHHLFSRIALGACRRPCAMLLKGPVQPSEVIQEGAGDNHRAVNATVGVCMVGCRGLEGRQLSRLG